MDFVPVFFVFFYNICLKPVFENVKKYNFCLIFARILAEIKQKMQFLLNFCKGFLQELSRNCNFCLISARVLAEIKQKL